MITARVLPLTLSLSLLLAACGQSPSDVAVSTPDAAITSAQAQTNTMLHTFARQLAASLTEPSVRTLIAQQTALKFDGDTDALYSTLATLATGKGTFAQTLSSGIGAQSLHTLTASLPKLNIAVHGGAWDAARTVPLVAVVPVGGDEFAPVTAYDAQGGVHQLDSRHAPDQPVVVVGLNERVDDQGMLQVSASAPTPANGSTISAQSCYQVRLRHLFLYDDKEPWTSGEPEIWAIVKGSGLWWHGEFTQVDGPGDYYNINKVFGCTGGDVTFYWYEKDGSNLDVTASYGGVSLGIKIDDSDDFLGGVLMRKSLFEGTSVNERNLGNLSQFTD